MALRRHRLALPLQAETKRGELLPELVVQIARDPCALVLLRGDDLAQQIDDVMMRGGAFLHLRLEMAGAFAHPRVEVGFHHPDRFGRLLLDGEIAGDLREPEPLAEADGTAAAEE